MPDSAALYLIPVPLGELPAAQVLPPVVISTVREIRYFIAEHAKNARRFLKEAGLNMTEIEVSELDKHHPEQGIRELLEPLKQGHALGVLSDAGMPGIADPGALLVAEAHRMQVPVIPLPGSSSIVLALAAAGFNGQSFSFVGYLPKDRELLREKLRLLEKTSARNNQPQVFIETPYRNLVVFQEMLTVLNPMTKINISCQLTVPGQFSITRTIQQWKNASAPDLRDKPTVFIIQG